MCFRYFARSFYFNKSPKIHPYAFNEHQSYHDSVGRWRRSTHCKTRDGEERCRQRYHGQQVVVRCISGLDLHPVLIFLHYGFFRYETTIEALTAHTRSTRGLRWFRAVSIGHEIDGYEAGRVFSSCDWFTVVHDPGLNNRFGDLLGSHLDYFTVVFRETG